MFAFTIEFPMIPNECTKGQKFDQHVAGGSEWNPYIGCSQLQGTGTLSVVTGYFRSFLVSRNATNILIP